MIKAALWLGTAALFSASASPQPALARDKNKDNDKSADGAAAIAGGLAAIGVGLAAATSKHGDDYRHDKQWDSDFYGDPFSPAGNVVCAPSHRQCNDRGYFSYSWTKRVFGSSAAFEGSGMNVDSGFGNFGNFGVDLGRAREVCLERSAAARLRNVTVESAKQISDNWAYVYMQVRPSEKSPDYQRWWCAYNFSNGKTDFKRM